jgi:hypothetical protein
MRSAMALLGILLLSGCATKYDLSGADWTKPGTMFYQTTLDEMECVRGAREAGWTPNLILGGLVDLTRWTIEEQVQRRGSYRRCMTAKGYRAS